MGLVFTLMGLLFAGIFGFAGFASGEWVFSAFGGLFGLIFAGIGISMLVNVSKSKAHKKLILEQGKRVHGRIVDYRDGSGVIVNGVPPLDIVVQFFDPLSNEERTIVVPTDQNSERGFPVGASLDIVILGTEAAIVPNTISFI